MSTMTDKEREHLEERFETAIDIVSSLKSRPSDEELLYMYGLYKQAKLGDNNTTAPWFFNVKDKAKWDAWEKNKGMSKWDAMRDYIKAAEILRVNHG